MRKPQTLAAIVAVALGGTVSTARADTMSRAEFEAYAHALDIGSVEALNDFLRAHPFSPVAPQVFERINELTKPSTAAEEDLAVSGTASIY